MQREESAMEQRRAWFIHNRFGLFIQRPAVLVPVIELFLK